MKGGDKVKWLRIILPIFLIMGMLLCINSVAYADPGDEDSDLKVDITVSGDNADVGVDLHGDDNTASVTFYSENPTVLINGQAINKPTVIHHTRTIDKRARQQLTILNTNLEQTAAMLNVTMDGLAKVIIKVQDQDSFNTYVLQGLDEHTMRLDEIDGEISSLHHQFSYLNVRLGDLEGRHNALATDVEEGQAAMLERLDKMELDYHRKLLIMAGVFLAVVLGLGLGLTRRIRRLRKMIS